MDSRRVNGSERLVLWPEIGRVTNVARIIAAPEDRDGKQPHVAGKGAQIIQMMDQRLPLGDLGDARLPKSTPDRTVHRVKVGEFG